MDSLVCPVISRAELAATLVGRLEARGYPPRLLNERLAPLYTGSIVLDRRKAALFLNECGATPVERAQFNRLFSGD